MGEFGAGLRGLRGEIGGEWGKLRKSRTEECIIVVM